MWDHGAQGEYFTFVNASVKRLINRLAKAGDNIRFVKGDEGIGKMFGVTYNRFESDFGILNMVLDRHTAANTLFAIWNRWRLLSSVVLSMRICLRLAITRKGISSMRALSSSSIAMLVLRSST